ncbi:CGNR zinc finger domain-containing protein [Streptomyces typhae]|uniref:CGNR zinc finger domain-containing protein n=1 Tax=Streptomyces typhae TaxID=2681492 RepID=UPI0031B5C6B0
MKKSRGEGAEAADDEWSTRHSVLRSAQRAAALVNVLSAADADGAAEAADADGADDVGTADGARSAESAESVKGAVSAASAGGPRAPGANAVTAVLREYGERGPLDVTAQDVADMRAVAARLREVFAAPDADTAAARLNRLLAEGCGPVRLTAHGGGTPWHIHLDGDDSAPWAEWFLASSCMALAVLLWDRQRPPGGLCASPRCDTVYVTGGSGAARRYCSPRCATRERVASHRRAKGARATAG